MGNKSIVWASLLLSVSALADVTSTATMADTTFLNLSTGSTNINGADLGWRASTGIFYQGNAKGLNLGAIGSASYGALSQAAVSQIATGANVTPIAPSTLTVGDVFVVVGNTGNATKAMVTANSGGTITFQFTTYGNTTGGANTPTITDVQNNSSLIPNGFSNSGVAPSTLVVIHGSGLADPSAQAVLQDSTKGLPTTLNGASVSVSAGGKVYPVGMYYAIATQIAGVLPAAVPIGAATVTVSYNGTPSAAFSFNVISSAFGINNYSGNTAVVQDPSLVTATDSGLLLPTRSGKPGEVVVLWGTGLSSDPSDSDVSYTSTPHPIGTPLQIYVGGVQVTNVAYAGASVYPGVHVIGFTIPNGVPYGCFVPIIIVTGGGTVSNSPTIPVMPNGGVCSDTDVNAVGGQNTQNPLRTGSLIVAQLTSAGSTSNFAQASFSSITNLSSVGGGGGGGQASVGTCTFLQINGNAGGGGAAFTGLDAGTLSLTGPAGSYSLQPIPNQKGSYYAALPAAAIPASGGTFTFNNGSGGVDVGGFTAMVTFPTPVISWTNQAAAANVTRANGLQVTWTGGQPGSTVFINGSSSNNGAVASFFCYAPQSALQLTVPSYVLAVLPAGSGSITLEDSTNYSPFTAPRLDYGYSIGIMGISVASTFQ